MEDKGMNDESLTRSETERMDGASAERTVSREEQWQPNLEIGPDFHVDAPDMNAKLVPDADSIDPDSPVDPVSPPTDVVNGTDLINGSIGDDSGKD